MTGSNVREFSDLGGRLLVLFDGNCGFCNASVRWLLRRDRRDRLRFAPSSSPRVSDLLRRHGFSVADFPSGPSTMVVVRDAGGPCEQPFLRSDADAVLLAELPQPWRAAGVCLRLIPRPIRDFGYRVIAAIRYRIWGRVEVCPLPTPADRGRFL